MIGATRRARSILSGVLGLAVVGCLGGPSNVLEGTTAARVRSGPAIDERVVIASRGLERTLRYGEVVSRRAGQLLHVQIALENVGRGPVAFEYRWEWTDAEGFQLGDTLSNWQPGYVNANEHALLTGVGPGPSAASFRLYLRQPGNE